MAYYTWFGGEKFNYKLCIICLLSMVCAFCDILFQCLVWAHLNFYRSFELIWLANQSIQLTLEENQCVLKGSVQYGIN